MDVLSACPLRVGSILWQPWPGAWMLTVVCKATHILLPGESPLAPEQDPPNEADDHWDDDERRSLHAVSDLVPYKSRADVFLVGHAYAPKGRPVPSLVARLVVGSADKSIEVRADRARAPDGQLREGAGFTRMPLVYERAAGGPHTSNPVGIPAQVGPNQDGWAPLPNLQPPGVDAARPGAVIPPIGFGPIAPSWPERTALLHAHAARWDHRRWSERPLPQGIDPRYFNVAPPDQQLGQLHDDAHIVLENLHPEHARLTTRRRGPSPRAVVERAGTVQELSLLCDTLYIDTDRGVLHAVWRGQVSLGRPDEAGRVLVTTAGDRPHPPPRALTEERSEEDEDRTVRVVHTRPGQEVEVGAAPRPEAETVRISAVRVAEVRALPFQARSPWAGVPAAGVSTGGTERREDEDRSGTVRVDRRAARPRPVLPFVDAPAPAPMSSPVPVDPPVAAPAEPPPFNPAPAPPAPSPPPEIEPAPAPPLPADLAPRAPSEPAPLPAAEPTAPDVTIERFATLCAELAEKRRRRVDVLGAAGLDEAAWAGVEQRWTEALAREAAKRGNQLRSASDRAWVEAVEGFRGPIGAEEFARVVWARERGRVDEVLDELRIQRPALMPLVRVWTKKAAASPKLGELVSKTLAKLRSEDVT